MYCGKKGQLDSHWVCTFNIKILFKVLFCLKNTWTRDKASEENQITPS